MNSSKMDDHSKHIRKAEKRADGRKKKDDKAKETHEKFGSYTAKHIRVQEAKATGNGKKEK